MLFLGAALALSTLSSVFATPHFESGRPSYAKRTRKLYARAEPINEKLGIHAQFEFVGYPDSPRSTFIKISVLKGLTNDPSLGGPFPYHIHTNPIPADGNCTKARLVCDPAFPEYCQTGDLSGKHGKLNGTSTGEIDTFGYSDAFVRFYPEELSLLGRSIVIHSANKTRLACANITSFLDGTANASFEPTHRSSTYVRHYPTAAPVQPSPPVIPFNGTQMTDPAVIASLPYPLPVPALTIRDAPNVVLGNVTHSVKYANAEHTITQPQETKVRTPFSVNTLQLLTASPNKSDAKSPFKGWYDTTW
ncbi:hypothetical protein FRC06_008171 [Ceratobasidium sp. 370]|nr:hypothetical protein FRC06_008171 [Ceratobasidium sp. 370]